MSDYKFNSWLKSKKINEWANFGFEPVLSPGHQRPGLAPKGDDPLDPLDVNYVMKQLTKHRLGVMDGDRKFFGEISWGDDVGAVKYTFSPLGGLRALIKKRVTDLDGSPVWILKKVIEVRHMYDNHPDTLISNSLTVLNEINGQGIDAASNEYKDLEKLVLKMAPKLRSTRMDLFVYEGIKKVKANEEYIIHFGVHGHGVQMPDQERLEQFSFNVIYDKHRGLIRIIGQEVASSLGQHKWKLNASEWDEYYSPAQAMEEIIETQTRLFHSY